MKSARVTIFLLNYPLLLKAVVREDRDLVKSAGTQKLEGFIHTAVQKLLAVCVRGDAHFCVQFFK